MPDDVLAAIRTPIYFLWGEQDPFGGADVARRIIDRIPTAELELVPRADHAVWMDDADYAATAIIRFLSSRQPSAPRSCRIAGAGPTLTTRSC